MNLIESSVGSISVESTLTEPPIALYDAQHTEGTPGSTIKLISSATSITAGTIFGCHLIPFELDGSNDAIEKTIAGFGFGYFYSLIRSDTIFTSVPGGSEVGIDISIGVLDEAFNSATVTFANVVTWNATSYTEFMAPSIRIARNTITNNTFMHIEDSTRTAGAFQYYTNIDPSSSTNGVISATGTALIVYYSYSSNCYGTLDIAESACLKDATNNLTHKYFTEV